ncbi:MAG TPA: sigma-70 family RNA polymerase sigma factor [Candidatus Hydrogenedentes bacterium]|nr:sigma-70 family RNA polymerase sigma factor [Candidatus Hydrogenedentota bacterium]
MSPSETALLEKWRRRRDAEAFNELVSRYAGLVFGTAKRILGNDADAEDVTQECFLRLAETTTPIRTSLGGWLHALATHRAVDLIKAESRRRRRERLFVEKNGQRTEVRWDDLEEYVDEAIAALPDKLRCVVVAHFLERKTHDAIATELGVSRPTVTYRIKRSVDRIRKHLEKRGIPVDASAFLGLAAANLGQVLPVPAAVTTALAKFAMSGIKTVPAREGILAAAKAMGWMLIMKKKILVLAVVFALMFAAGVYVRLSARQERDPERKPAATQETVEKRESSRSAELTPPMEPPSLATVIEASNEPTTQIGAATPEPGSIIGVVMDNSGYPIPNARVLVVAAPSWEGDLIMDKRNHYWATSGADGEYTMTGILHSGRASVTAYADGYSVGGRYAFGREIPLNPGAVQEVDITMSPALMLTGRLLSAQGAPIADGVVRVLCYCSRSDSRVGGSGLIAYTDSEGVFRLGMEQWGVVALDVRAPNHGTGVFTNVPIGEDNLIDLRLSEPATLKGQVIWSGGAPAAAVCVRLQARVPVGDRGTCATNCCTYRPYRVTTDSDGVYEFARIDSGVPYSAYVSVVAEEERAANPERPTHIDPLAPREVRRVDIAVQRIEEQMIVKGHVYGVQTGRLIWPARVFPAKGNGEWVPHTGQLVAMDGSYELRLTALPGEFVIYPNYYDHSLPAGEMLREFGKKVHLSAGETVELDLTIPECVSASVRVVDQLGTPVEDAAITLVQDHTGFGGKKTNADGRWASSSITPWTEFWFKVSKEGYADKETEHHLGEEPGHVCPEETIVLFQSGRVQGVAVDASGEVLSGRTVNARAHYEHGEMALEPTRTDRDGVFTIMGIPATGVTLEVSIQTGQTGRGGSFYGSRAVIEIECLAGHIIELGEVLFSPPR